MTGLVYSIGHSSLDIETFLTHLRRFDIDLVADVRRFPRSQRHRHFDRKALEVLLRQASIGYEPLGEDLGGFRDGSYGSYARGAAFSRGVDRLRALACEKTTAFMCAEKLPWLCHRWFIAEALEAKGIAVRHIADGQLLL